MDIFNLASVNAPPDLLTAKVNQIYFESKPMLHLQIDESSETSAYLRQRAKQHKLYHKTQDALVKAYYLYYFLIQWADLSGQFVTNDVEIALGINKETRFKIDGILQEAGLLTIHKENHFESVRTKLLMDEYELPSNIAPYTYEFSVHVAANDQHKVKAQKISYPLPRKLWESLVKKGYAFRDNSFLTDVLDKECDHKVKQPTIKLIGKGIYVPPYNRIRLSPQLLTMRVKDVKNIINIADAKSWIQNKNKPTKFTSGRLYHAFHLTPHRLRKHLEFNGSPLVEALDIHSAFFLLLSKIFHVVERVDGIPINQEELQRYDKLVRDGRFYEDVMEFENCFIRDQMKARLNAFKNATNSSMSRYPEYRYFKERFPTLLEVLKKYPTYKDKDDGSDTKYMQIDLSYIETYLISSVCDELKELGVTPFSLHDAIYVSKWDYDSLAERGININEIFWGKFDSLTDDEVVALLHKSRSCRL